MALTRKFLSALGIESDKVDEIIDAHMETVNGLKTERDENKDYKAKFEAMKKELDEANATIENQGKDAYREKYDALKAEFDTFKADTEANALKATKDKAYRAMLLEAGVSEKRLDAIMKVTDLTRVDMDGDALKDVDKLKETVSKEWADFITTTKADGAGTATPPPGGDDNNNTAKPIPLIF